MAKRSRTMFIVNVSCTTVLLLGVVIKWYTDDQEVLDSNPADAVSELLEFRLPDFAS